MKSKTTKTKTRNDWQAIERDYRTGQLTLKELEAKHGAGYAEISRRAKREGWTKDLRHAVRQATSAAVIAETTREIARKAQSATIETADVVFAAAELNKQVILGHRRELQRLRAIASALLDELAQAGVLLEHREALARILAGPDAEPVDIAQAEAAIAKALSLGNRAQTLKALAESIVKIQAAERIAFGLDERDEDKNKDSVSTALSEFFSGIHGASAGRLTFSPAR